MNSALAQDPADDVAAVQNGARREGVGRDLPVCLGIKAAEGTDSLFIQGLIETVSTESVHVPTFFLCAIIAQNPNFFKRKAGGGPPAFRLIQNIVVHGRAVRCQGQELITVFHTP